MEIKGLNAYQMGGKAKREYLQFGKFPVNPFDPDTEQNKFNQWYEGYLNKSV